MNWSQVTTCKQGYLDLMQASKKPREEKQSGCGSDGCSISADLVDVE